ncbi:hypothetical protein CCR75_004041 [Bremia lactucae]|uniref:Uncharacterized protein n=1 Tax=Bremia lactucae TaxID=4779 RepID=A0A976IBB4_BRELC|nr:hypothetical protein CCR75_004041 [Bremia lactucae]
MCQIANTATKPILLCVDFDETITLYDTTSVLFQLAPSSSLVQKQLLATQYADEVTQYLRNYEIKWQQEIDSSNHNRSFDGSGLREFLKGYAAADLRSLHRVVEHRALKGIQKQDLIQAASCVQTRPNCAETLLIPFHWNIISVNWSKELIKTVMTQAGVACETTQIIANDLIMNEQEVTTGEIDMIVQSPGDKARWITNMRVIHAEIQSTIVYVGDSATDLLALLSADVGIWLASNILTPSAKLLRRLMEVYGIATIELVNCCSFNDCVSKASDSRPVIFLASDWAQLRSILERTT